MHGKEKGEGTDFYITFLLQSPTGEGNGTPLQCSCLENHMDRGAWWAAAQRVPQSWTRLKRLSMHACIGEGNGSPLQCSCLENPRDGVAWWAAVYGVAQSRTRLKRLSSSSNVGNGPERCFCVRIIPYQQEGATSLGVCLVWDDRS